MPQSVACCFGQNNKTGSQQQDILFIHEKHTEKTPPALTYIPKFYFLQILYFMGGSLSLHIIHETLTGNVVVQAVYIFLKSVYFKKK